MTPGDIVMMLNEMGGMRVQATSPSIGAASVRVQGMKGRYTRFLSDGLPLFGQQVGGLGLLQIPPMDLGQVEVIKGAASALYGAGAMGGVVNLLSRRPGRRAGARDARQSFDARRHRRRGFLSSPLGHGWSASLLGGGHWQTRNDIDDDGWADVAGYGRGDRAPAAVLGWRRRPLGIRDRRRHLREPRRRHDDRRRRCPRRDCPTRRHSTRGATMSAARCRRWWKNRYVITARAAAAWQRQDHRVRRHGRTRRARHGVRRSHGRGAAGRQTWVAGAASSVTPSIRATCRALPTRTTFPACSSRTTSIWRRGCRSRPSAPRGLPQRIRHVLQPAPRGALPPRTAGPAGSRPAQGFFASTPLTEETEAAGLSRLDVDATARGRARTDRVPRPHAHGRRRVVHGDALRLARRRPGRRRSRRPVRALQPRRGIDQRRRRTAGTCRHGPFAATASYTYVRSREESRRPPAGDAADAAHSAGLVGMWEPEGVGRVGIEVYYTGRQRLEENPVPRRVAPYVIVGLLAERRFGRVPAVPQRREPDRRPPDAVGPAGAAVAQAPTAAGPWTAGRRSTAASSTAACGWSSKASEPRAAYRACQPGFT